MFFIIRSLFESTESFSRLLTYVDENNWDLLNYKGKYKESYIYFESYIYLKKQD